MKRFYSTQHLQSLRETEGCGLFEAIKKIRVSQILDAVEASDNIEDLRAALSDFIKYQTGVS